MQRERIEKRQQLIRNVNLNYDADLPIVQRREEILDFIRKHQTVIVCGETGSGKSTQLPKFCLELGRGIHGIIGHTQPRRIAARTIAQRIADELQTPLGTVAGYKVRFEEKLNRDTPLKIMTDGILLAETQSDKTFRQYDTLIIDEAHERTLNIDFLLGMLKRILPQRPDLKLIITSATLDAKRFSEHFDNVPIIEVSGRSYPIEILYRDPVSQGDLSPDNEPPDEDDILLDTVRDVLSMGGGDVLVFLPTERDIQDAKKMLTVGQVPPLINCDILPLFSRLPAAEQQKVFQLSQY
ncbi:MAG: DEAD/DEAH box helicase, partial [Planctomycetaceae bacterium]|nr:DEAD/DEAH box helicase [Planctomycetaceae bacterium]